MFPTSKLLFENLLYQNNSPKLNLFHKKQAPQIPITSYIEGIMDKTISSTIYVEFPDNRICEPNEKQILPWRIPTAYWMANNSIAYPRLRIKYVDSVMVCVCVNELEYTEKVSDYFVYLQFLGAV